MPRTGLGVLFGPCSLNYLGGTFRESWFAFWPQDPELQTSKRFAGGWAVGIPAPAEITVANSFPGLPMAPPLIPFPHSPHEAKRAHCFAPVMPVMLLSGVGGSLDQRGLFSKGSVWEMGLTPQPASPAPTGTFSQH